MSSDNIETELQKMDTAGSVLMTKELFEKLYLSPETKVAGQLRKTFANPTPLGLSGFLLALTPLSVALMGWGGSGGSGAAQIGGLYFLGGLLAVLTAIGEFLLGNAFSMVTFGVYGGFFIAYGATLQPSFNAYIAYDPTNPALAPVSPGFLSTFAFLLVFMALFNFIMLICSIRTNVIFVLVFVCLEMAFCFASASYFYGSQGDILGNYHQYQQAAGGCAFGAAVFGWYQLLGLMLEIVDFPIQLPVGDLSAHIKGRSEHIAEKKPNNMA